MLLGAGNFGLNRKWKRFLGAIEEESQGKVPADFSEVVQAIDQMLAKL